MSCIGITSADLPVNEYVCDGCISEVLNNENDSTPNSANILPEETTESEEDVGLTSDTIHTPNRRSISIIEEFNEVIVNGRQQVNFYIQEIERLTVENQELKYENSRLKEECARDREAMKAEKSGLEEELERYKEELNVFKKDKNTSMNENRTVNGIDWTNQIRRLEEKQAVTEKRHKQFENTVVKQLKVLADTCEVLNNSRSKCETKLANIEGSVANPIRNGVGDSQASKVSPQGGNKQGGDVPGIKRGGSWTEVRRKKKRRGKGKKNQGRAQKFKVFADSHGRDLSKLLAGAEVTVKGGAIMERVAEGVGKEEGGLCSVIMGGTNDDSVEGMKRGLFKIREGLGVNKRVVIVGVPHRYDETHRYNNKLLTKEEIIARNELIARKNELLSNFCHHWGYRFLSIDDSERHFFTRHGLHFNMEGKRWLAHKIQTAVHFL